MGDAPTLSSVLDSVRPLAEAGASLHWLVPFEKRPINKNWSTAPRLSLPELKAAYRTGANIGIRLGEPSKIGGYYLHLIDLDITRPDLVDTVWAKLLELYPHASFLPSVISGSGGDSRHIYFLSDKPFRKKVLAYEKGASGEGNVWEIVLMGTGSQAVIPPSIHPDTRQPYRWASLPDFDFPDLMSIPSATVESWGAKEDRPLDEGDDDDLETLFNNSPLDLSDEEIERALAALPNEGVGAHYDEYIEVGMALHHQFQGSDEGFYRWVAWAEQSEKFDEKHARYRWDKSFGEGRSAPVTFRTIIQKANANRLAGDHDFDLDLGDAPVSIGTALVPYDPYSLDDLLGGEPAPVAPKETIVSRQTEADSDWQLLLARNEEGELKSNLHNIFTLVDCDARIFLVKEFNDFRQERVFRQMPRRMKKKRDSAKPIVNLDGPHWVVKDPVNGDSFTDTHLSDIRRMIEAPTTQGGYGIKVSDRDLVSALELAARKNSFHPIRERLMSVTWDGVPRMETLFIDYLGCKDDKYHRQVAKLFLVGAVARIFQPGHKFDFVPILEGTQGKGKTTFIETLALDWYRELTGDISDPQHVVGALKGAWILELGELSAMQKQEVNDLKAFVSRKVDTARLPYERTFRDFPRQCVFMGSTNDDTYLRDQTGGRRFWPVRCEIEGQIDNKRLRREVMQIWAETLQVYQQMCSGKRVELDLQLADEAVDQALLLQDSRRVESAEDVLRGQIEAWLETPIEDDSGFDDLDADAPKTYRTETCTAQIWTEMLGKNGAIPHIDTMKIGKALGLLGWKKTPNDVTRYKINKKYGRCRVYVKPD